MEGDKKKQQLRCCIGCGRDTLAASGICLDCAGLGSRRSPLERGDQNRTPDGDEEYIRRKTDR